MHTGRAHIQIIAGFLAILIFLIGFSSNVSAQNRKQDLQKEKQAIEKEIKYTNDLLERTSRNKESNINGLVILKKKINQRERLINTIRAEISLIENEIEETVDSILALNVELKKYKEEYARMIYYAYRNRSSYDRLVFIFSSKDFNQAYRRLRYFQQYGSYRRTQARLIAQTQEELNAKEQELEARRNEKQDLLASAENERSLLQTERSTVNSTIQDLSKQEKQLRSDLRKKRKAVAEMEKAIEKIIAEEIRLAEERARAEASSSTTASGFALTPDEMILSENFASNKGKLPWPIERGIISSTFGEHNHPVLTRVKVKNNGIDILTSEGEYARAVFSGEVTRVISVPNFNNVVIIRHGEYLTVYSNLDEVLVSKGERVDTKQKIGRVYTNKNENKTQIHFEIWKAKELMNPALWLAGKQ
ncbi:MAG: peptidoglycan DD-metalloendopeptidase family protein [Bacteroidales bacterium]|nr:peptidoglycan DD-metalloendopeptidase family protein [Bacteroidales bacterium]